MTVEAKEDRFSKPPQGASVYSQVQLGRVYYRSGALGEGTLERREDGTYLVCVAHRRYVPWSKRRKLQTLSPRSFKTYYRALGYLHNQVFKF